MCWVDSGNAFGRAENKCKLGATVHRWRRWRGQVHVKVLLNEFLAFPFQIQSRYDTKASP
jgi:hypothetical protein